MTAVVAYGCRKGAPTSSSTSSKLPEKHMSATICSIPVHDGVFGSQVVNSVQQQQQKRETNTTATRSRPEGATRNRTPTASDGRSEYRDYRSAELLLSAFTGI